MTRRNDPCPCRSGRKYKQCCLKARGGEAPAYDRARAAHCAGRFKEAIEGYRRVLAAEGDHAGAMRHLAVLMGTLGQPAEGLELLDRAIAAGGRDPDMHIDRASMLHQLGRVDEALETCRHALALNPDHARAHCFEAYVHERAHRLDEARASVELALAADGGNAMAGILMAAYERRGGEPAAALRRLDELLERSDLPAVHREHATHERGLALDRLHRCAEAFEAFEAAGRLALEQPRAQRAGRHVWPLRITAYRDGLRRALMPSAAPADGRPRPTFLVGFPRSGTTLTEQVLAAHPRVVTSDERPLLHTAAEALRRVAPGADVVERLAALDDDRRRQIREIYWTAADDIIGHDDPALTFVDKLPLNLVDVGLINAVFPEARLIVALRDPRDACLSCLMQRFEANAAMVHLMTMADIVEFYDSVMDLWRNVRDEVITIPWLEIRYEQTVEDLPAAAAKLLEWLDLPWDPAVLSFHEAARQRTISTPSYAAVAEPVHRRAVGRWRRYEEPMGPHLDRLRGQVEALGYDATESIA